jgi:hypothetical protein
VDQASPNGNDHHPWEGRKNELHAIESNGASPDRVHLEKKRENCCLVAEISLLNHAMVSFQKIRPEVGQLTNNNNSTMEKTTTTTSSKNPTAMIYRHNTVPESNSA